MGDHQDRLASELEKPRHPATVANHLLRICKLGALQKFVSIAHTLPCIDTAGMQRSGC